MLGWLKATKIHFVGVGGIGMSGIAEILLDSGFQVSGSDLAASSVTERLAVKGAVVHRGHEAGHVEGSSLVVYSSAIDPKNPEFARAQELGIPLIRRGEMLAELMRLKYGLAVAGSHGKTTTSSLLASMFHEAKLDPTHVIGGMIHHLGGNAHKGDGNFLVAEADESDGSFLFLNPIMAAVTNIDDDHLDHYGSQERIVDAFVEFVNKLPFYGRAALNADDPLSQGIRHRVRRPVVWYGIETEADYVARGLKLSASGTAFDLHVQGRLVREIRVPLVGRHNVSNALAAIALAHGAEIPWEAVQGGLSNFRGVGRRMENIFERQELLVLDDYGHHPTEIRATISALKEVDGRRLCVVFEPHRFTRTKNFWVEFQQAFEGADEIWISPIYGAGESPLPGITSEALVGEMLSMGQDVVFMPTLDDLVPLLRSKMGKPAVVLTLGAGAISKKARDAIATL